MNKTSNINNKEIEIIIDPKHKKVFFNGNEVVKISFNFEGGKFIDYPYYSIMLAAVDAKAGNLRNYFDNNFTLYALTYKDNSNKEHLVVVEYGKCGEVGSWDSIEVRPDHEYNESLVVYGINDGKKVDTIVLKMISLLGFNIDDNGVDNAGTINLGYSVCR